MASCGVSRQSISLSAVVDNVGTECNRARVANIAEVAAAAGVSTSTVSRAFVAPHSVRVDTRERVLTVARRLGYTPNRVARSLAMGKTGSLGLIVPDVANPFFAMILKAVQARARRKEYTIFLVDTDEHPADEYELAVALTAQVDGLLLVSSRMPDERVREVIARTPTILVNRRIEGVPGVLVPSTDGMTQAVQHLHALGHRTCCYVSASHTSWSNAQRVAAVRTAGATLGMELIELGPFEPRFDAGVRAADLVPASGATAVIAHNDMVALGTMARFAQRGIAVPDDVSVVGVDDTLLATAADPPLTSVRIPLEEIGTRAVDLLLDALGGHRDAPPAVVEMPTALMVRASTGPVKVE